MRKFLALVLGCVVVACVAKVSDGGDAGVDAGTEAGSDASSDAADGCATTNWYSGAGCVAPPRTCQADWDACATVMCDCQGKTFTGQCGWSGDRPFAHLGACDGGGD